MQQEKLQEFLDSTISKPLKGLNMSSYKGGREFLLCREGVILARVYTANKLWYIWYEKDCYRLQVKNFTKALSMLETEFAIR